MNETLKYRILTTIRYFGDAFFYPFFSLYLMSTKLSESKIGFILSLTPIISIIANPIFSHLCKDVKTTKNVLKIITVLEAIIIILIGLSVNFYTIVVLTILLALFGSSHYGLLDSITAVYADKYKINYSNIRIYGSIAYIVATTLGGYIIDWLGYEASFICSGILFILCGIFYQLIKPIEIDRDNIKEKEKINYKDLLMNKTYILFVIFYVLLQGTSSACDNFFSVYLESRGLESNQYGIVYSYFVIFEVITLFILNRVAKRYNKNILLLISSICLVVRMFVNYLYLPVLVVVLFSALRGLGFGIVLYVSYGYIVRIVGESKGTFAIMFLTLIQAIYVAVFYNVNGIIIENYSYKTFYLVTTIISLIAVGIGIFRCIYYRKKGKEKDENITN